MLLKSYSSIDGLHVIREESTPDIEMAAFTEQLRELRESVERIVESMCNIILRINYWFFLITI